MKKGDRVITPNGPGVIEDIEPWSAHNRYGVKLDKNPFWYPIAYYFKHEVTHE